MKIEDEIHYVIKKKENHKVEGSPAISYPFLSGDNSYVQKMNDAISYNLDGVIVKFFSFKNHDAHEIVRCTTKCEIIEIKIEPKKEIVIRGVVERSGLML